MASGKKTVKNRTEMTVTDHTTGEALSSEKTVTYRVPREPDFVKVYTGAFKEVVTKKGCHLAMFMLLVDKMGYENEIGLTPAGRVRICEALGIQAQTFRNHLNDLLERDVLRRTSHGEFIVNPTYIARGEFEKILPRIEAYNKIGRVKTKKGRAPKPKESLEESTN
jgi:hypothetical protein